MGFWGFGQEAGGDQWVYDHWSPLLRTPKLQNPKTPVYVDYLFVKIIFIII